MTLQPVRRHGVDAAVMFADIMLPVLGMGIDVELVESVGPVIAEPMRTAADVERLRVPDPDESVPFLLEAVRLVRAELEPERGLVGFCGGPFTVAGYVIEGKPTRDFVRVKTMMYREPAVWHALMERLTETSVAYVRAKVEAGADVIQVFDSWVGALSPADYEEFVAPYSARILAAVDVPTIHFGTGTATLLDAMADAGGDVIGGRLADPAGPRLGGRWRDARRTGQSRPARPARAAGARGGRGARRARRGRRPARPHLQPRPRRPSRDGSCRPAAAGRAGA